MRARNIKPGFFKNEYLAELSPFARLLFIGLWLMADKEGRLEYRPKRIKAELLPYDSVEIEKLLDELCNAHDDSCKFVSRYEVDGCQFLFIHKFVEHQNPHKNEKESIFPPFTNIPVITRQVPNLHHTNPAESVSLLLNPERGILNPSPQIPEKNGAGVNHEKLISLWNEKSGCRPVIILSPKQMAWATNLLREHSDVSFWGDIFSDISKSPFMRGEEGNWSGADLGWVVDPNNWANVVNRRYVEREGSGNGKNGGIKRGATHADRVHSATFSDLSLQHMPDLG